MRRALVLALIAVMMMIGGVAHAAWLATGSGFGTSTAGTMPQGSQPNASLSNGDATVSWAQNTSPTVDGYQIVRYVSGGQQTNIGSNCDVDPVVADNCTEFNAPEGRWQYTVTPKLGNWLGAESVPSDELHVPTRTPTNLTAVGSSETSITVTWVDNSEINDAYQVESSPDGENDWTVLSSTEPADSESLVDEGLSCETTRYYRVKALSAANDDSAYSNMTSATTQSCPEATAMRVSGLSSTYGGTGTQRTGTVVVTISESDDEDSRIGEATVSGRWDWTTPAGGGTTHNEAASCSPTDNDGESTCTKTNFPNNASGVTFTVTGVSHQDYDYDPTKNTVTSIELN